MKCCQENFLDSYQNTMKQWCFQVKINFSCNWKRYLVYYSLYVRVRTLILVWRRPPTSYSVQGNIFERWEIHWLFQTKRKTKLWRSMLVMKATLVLQKFKLLFWRQTSTNLMIIFVHTRRIMLHNAAWWKRSVIVVTCLHTCVKQISNVIAN